MIAICTLLTIICAYAAAQNDSLTKLSSEAITLKHDDIAALNHTVQKLGIDKDLVAKLSGLVKNISLPQDLSFTYDDSAGPKVGVVEESPDYASSVVLASDLLSLTSAVASVQEKTCREQGYKFLDGLLMNKRWALKSKYQLYISIYSCTLKAVLC